MEVSKHFEQALFYDQNSATDAFFEERASKLFELDKVQPYIQIAFQKPLPDKTPDVISGRLSDSERTPEVLPNSEFESTSQGTKLLVHDGEPRSQQRSQKAFTIDRRQVQDVEDLNRVAFEPKHSFRVCLVRQRHSFSRLHITRELFEALMFEFGIFPRFREFVLLFGIRHEENEIGPPPIRFRRRTIGDPLYAGLTQRRYAGFECAYILRYDESNYRDSNLPWSLCPSAIYHNYSFSDKSSTWVMISAPGRTEQCINRYLKCSSNLVAHNPFEMHLLILETALADWRRYIINLTERISKHSDRVIVASIEEKDPLQLIDVEQHQMIKDLEDAVVDMLLVLDSTIDTISSLIENYKQFCLDVEADIVSSDDKGFDTIGFALREKHREVLFNRKKVETLQTKVQGMSNLSSSILDLGNGQSLKRLAEETRKENVAMRKLTEKSAEDAAAVKTLTMITLIYLPTAIVLNFFSTQFVAQEQSDGGARRLVVTSNTWLFAAVSAPLTVGTLLVWWLWVQFQTGRLWLSISSTKFMSLRGFLGSSRRKRKPLDDCPGVALEP